MVRLDELDETVAPAQLQLHASPVTAVPGLWLASRDACATPAAAAQLASAGGRSILVFGPTGRWVEHDAFGGDDARVHVYARATNGALITNLKDACDFIARALPVGGVACVSDERGDDHRDASSSSPSSRGGDGEPGAAFACAAYMIVAKGMGAQEAADAVETSRPGCGLRAHDEFMKNLRFLQRNGIPDWA